MSEPYTNHIQRIAEDLGRLLLKKDEEYGGSWLKRGGVGAYFVSVRKSDRLETQVAKHGYDVFRAIEVTRDTGEPLSDTLLDLAGYAILILAEAKARGLLDAAKKS